MAFVEPRLFVVEGDLNRIRCDAVLVPTDSGRRMSGSFDRLLADGWKTRTKFPSTWTVARDPGASEPQVWFGNVGSIGLSPEPYVRVVEDYVRLASDKLGPGQWRIALPLVGTRHGGMVHDKGAIVQAIVDRLAELAGECSVDIVLVTWERADYAAAQRARLRHVSAVDGSSSVTPSDAHIEELAELARQGRLVVFVGAGVSAGAGLPDWQGLLDELAASAPGDPIDLDALRRLDVRDQAQILSKRHGPAFKDRMAEALTTERYSLAHGLIASIDPGEVVTTNYDTLMEKAFSRLRPRAVLPHEPVTGSGRWLLKLHGTLDDLDGLVLTRDEYLGLPETSGALFGIVQSMLLTKHMLFVGYSLKDDSFHRVMHEVRRARGGAESGRLGTVITLGEDPLLTELWGAQLHVVPAGPGLEIDDAKRAVEVLLDEIALAAADVSAFLLDDSFESMLDDHEKVVKARLRSLIDVLDDREPVSADLLRRLGDLAPP